jgi:Carbohydrate-binding family 9
MAHYTIHKTETAPLEAIDFSQAEEGRVAVVRPESNGYAPETRFYVLHDGQALYVQFRVSEATVRSVQTAYQSPVYTDSCVEFFVQPVRGKGYFNLEINAGGTLLASYIEDPTRGPNGFAKWTPLDWAWGKQIEIRSSLPRVVEPEQALDWTLRYRLPWALLEQYAGPITEKNWRGNFYKCGNATSHPHWVSWAPLTARNFHLPACFGSLELA